MTRPHDWLGIAVAVALWGGGAAWGAAPAIHAVVLSDPGDGATGATYAAVVADALRASSAYVLLDPGFLEGRLLEEPGALFRRCASDVRCWRAAGQHGGVEQVVLVDVVDHGTMGVRVVDVGGTGDFRMAAAATISGQPDPALMLELFFRPGGLRLVDVPAQALVRLDDGPAVRANGATVQLSGVAGGKHAVEVIRDDGSTEFVTCLVIPDQVTTVGLTNETPPRARRRITRWTTWVAAGLLAGGAAAVGLSMDAGGPGVPP